MTAARPATAAALLAVVLAAAGCGGSSKSGTAPSASYRAPAAQSTQTTKTTPTTPTTTQTAPTTATSPAGQSPGSASVDVRPGTTGPGRTVVATLHAPASTTQVVFAFQARGAPVTAQGHKTGGIFEATLVIPSGTPGGFWPVTARYQGPNGAATATTQVKVFTP